MSDLAITFSVLGAMVALFVANRIPAAPVALAGLLVLYFAGVLDTTETLAGFGDSAVIFIASLFVVSAALQASGVTAWVGKRLIAQAGESRNRLLAFTMLLAAGITALVGTSAAVTALLPVVILATLRLGHRPSKLMMPLAFAAHAGSMLLLTGSLTNVLVSDAAVDLGLPPLGFFGPTVLGLPILAGTIAIVLLFGERLLPERAGRGLPPDLSRHHRTLAAQYELVRQLHQLEIAPGSAYAGMAKAALSRVMERNNRPDFALIAIRPRDADAPLLRAGDRLLVRGTPEAVATFATEAGLQPSAEPPEPADIQQALFNAREGFAEVVLPPRSGLIGERVFPGQITESGDLMILGIQRHGEPLGPGEVTLAAGDTLLLQGEWEKLDRRIRDPDVLVVASPEAIRSQAVPLGRGSRRAVAILAGMVALMAAGAVPNVMAALTAACAMVLARVLTLDQAYRAVKLNSLIMIASLLPVATAMYKTGAAMLIAEWLAGGVGAVGPFSLLASLFLVAAASAQVIGGTAATLVVIPIAVAAAGATGISPMPALMAVAVGATACFLTPVASSACLMVQAPGGYRFGDYWKLGLPLLLWSFIVATLLIPLFWPTGR
jgi:di/tricarboxylate transporter